MYYCTYNFLSSILEIILEAHQLKAGLSDATRMRCASAWNGPVDLKTPL